MDVIQNKIDALKWLQNGGIDELVLECIKEHEAEIVGLNQEQMYEGKNAKGEDIRPEYRPSTIIYKKRKSQPYDRVTLKDKGNFYEGFYLEFGVNDFEIKSRDKKEVLLKRKYGSDVFGLNKEYVGKVGEVIKDSLNKKVRKLLA